MAYLHTLWEVADVLIDKLKDNSGPLGINYVGSYDEKRLPRYPAVVVSPGSRTKEIAGVGKFDVAFLVDLWVYHAELTLSHAARSKKDLQLVADIETLLESDYNLKDGNGIDQIVFGFVTNETPGIMQGNANKTEMIVCTRMQWMATSRRGFVY